MSPEKRRAYEVIETAQKENLWGMRRFKIDSDTYVLLHQICHAIEILSGNLERPMQDWMPVSQLKLLRALGDCEVTARTQETNTVIPGDSWPTEIETASEAFDADFWCGAIERDEDCRGFRGHLPVVPIEDATSWLAQFQMLEAKPGNPFSTTAERESAYNNWLDTIPGRNPTVSQREAWRNAHGIRRDVERHMWETHKPEDGSKPGVKPKKG